MNKDNKQNSGFTLIEMMVAVSLFLIVAMIVSVTFLTLANIYRKIQSNRAVIDSINFMMDTISYELREGRDWSPGDSCDNGIVDCYTGITFDRLDSFTGETQQVSYDFDADQEAVTQSINGRSVSLNSREVTIDQFEIYTDVSDPVPKATIIIHGSAQTGKIITDFSLQTSLSQRNN